MPITRKTIGLIYRGYTFVVWVNWEAGVIRGHLYGLKDVITFQGATVAEAEDACCKSVDDYLEFCSSRGEEPEKP